ncbi:MAG TPA: protein-glutamate O-methyltransferase CheR, partial [Patescibacteria group bacterium]|nr:protein-glutamate O-methyltransferase CheR [Patescibacteria group bacterium]
MEITELDFEMLLQDILQTYGYDFKNYSRASLKRRINRTIVMEHIPSFAELRYKTLRDADFFAYFLEELTVNVSEM